MRTFRIGAVGLASALAGFTLQGCFAAQATPECQVSTAEADYALSPYYVKLTNPTSACSSLDHLSVGLQRFTTPDGGGFRLGVRTSFLMDYALGYHLEANVDPSNDCADEEGCEDCTVDPGDGGVVLVDGGLITEEPLEDGGVIYVTPDDDQGGTREVFPDNVCEAIDEPVTRVDPADPEGRKLVALGDLPRYPTADRCAVTDLEVSAQAFQAETTVEGTEIPAVTARVEWADFNVIMSPKVPGTAFTSKVTITENGCVTTFDALGFWPAVACASDDDCDPFADVDAGRFLGSGINPLFEPRCNLDLQICEPGVDVTTLK